MSYREKINGKVLKKWNYMTRTYDDCVIPDDWCCEILSYSDMLNDDINYDKKVNCPHCGKLVKLGDTFASLEFHSEYGLGYPVCVECYRKEIKNKEFYNHKGGL